jgi:hypothetical protein
MSPDWSAIPTEICAWQHHDSSGTKLVSFKHDPDIAGDPGLRVPQLYPDAKPTARRRQKRALSALCLSV